MSITPHHSPQGQTPLLPPSIDGKTELRKDKLPQTQTLLTPNPGLPTTTIFPSTAVPRLLTN